MNYSKLYQKKSSFPVSTRRKSKKLLWVGLAVFVVYSMVFNTNLEKKKRELLLEEHERIRDLITIDKGSGDCDIRSPFEDATYEPSSDTKRTIIASYPGSGKRFTWTIIKALTNYEAADDWDFSEKLFENPLTVKTSHPHQEGHWSFQIPMNQVLLLVRNPRRAIPSYHTMRWELEYSTSYPKSKSRIPFTYRDRPEVDKWESWRDAKFNREIDEWLNFYRYWLSGGIPKGKGEMDHGCIYKMGPDGDCFPKQIVDFDNLYSDQPTEEYDKISSLIHNAIGYANVSQADNDKKYVLYGVRNCVLNNVYHRVGNEIVNMHQASRPFPYRPNEYRFTVSQFDRIFNRTLTLQSELNLTIPWPVVEEDNVTMQEEHDWETYKNHQYFDRILTMYSDVNYEEYDLEVDLFLNEFVAFEFFNDDSGDPECGTLVYPDDQVCLFMNNRLNHGVFSDDDFPDDFPYANWLKERSLLSRLYENLAGDQWVHNSGWAGELDHCQWYGVTCGQNETRFEYKVISLDLHDNNLQGDFPQDLHRLDALELMNLDGNSINRLVPDELCALSTSNKLYISGDDKNCPNGFDGTTGEYKVSQCCNDVMINVDGYLKKFAHFILKNTGECNNLAVINNEVCSWMTERENHGIFEDGFPGRYNGQESIWKWLEERSLLVKMYKETDGDNWTRKAGWLGSSDHCTWEGVTCDAPLRELLSENKRALQEVKYVFSLDLHDNNMNGPFPVYLHDYLKQMNYYAMYGNNLQGTISITSTSRSNDNVPDLDGDAMNCPNTFNGAIGKYNSDGCRKVLINAQIYLQEFANYVLGNRDCNFAGTEKNVCTFMSDKDNHAIFANGFPEDFQGDVWDWLKERATLVRMYENTNGGAWNRKAGWASSSDHCSWQGVVCSTQNRVNELDLQNNNMSGEFPSDFSNLGNLAKLSTLGNSLTGDIPDDLKNVNGLEIFGDSTNCHNTFNALTGKYNSDGCTGVLIDVDLYLIQFATHVLGDEKCNFEGAEKNVCTFMVNKNNHAILANGYPSNSEFAGNVWDWLKERTTLTRIYLNDGGDTWTQKTGWMSSDNHCVSWWGINCSVTSSITSINLQNNALSGEFPSDLDNLIYLHSLIVHDNSLYGMIPNDFCTRSTLTDLYVYGDIANCPNTFNTATGQYEEGCCDTLNINTDIYLENFASVVFGNTECIQLAGTEVDVCSFMRNKVNHAIFNDGFPSKFNGVWSWLKERTILVRIYMNNGGALWTQKTGWVSSQNHCDWEGITCNTSGFVVELNLQTNQLSGQFPNDLNVLEYLQYLRTFENSLVGDIPKNICDKSTSSSSNLYIHADSTNCPNKFNTATGQYRDGCCDIVNTQTSV